MGKIHIGEGLSLPLDAVTQKFAFLGRTGSGKTYAAGKLVEEMLGHRAQVIVIDPVGAWWGLRLAADGKGPGISIPVFGGLHGDVPLEVNSGKYMADLLVSHGTSAVLDISQFESDADKVRFLEPFGNQLFFRKKQSPSAMHMVIEECQEVVPQNPMKGEEKMLHAYSRIEKLGRNFGIGVSLISQRPQEINKKALNQTECMFAFQMTGPQERKAIKDWIQEKGLDVDIVDILPRLKQGEAHVWSPQWLMISAEYAIGEKQTFNASATPEVGKKAVTRELAPIDLERIRVEMAATIERAKADDPKELRRRIAELERAAKVAPKIQVDEHAIQSAVESAVSQRDQEWRQQIAEQVTLIERMQSVLAAIGKAAADYVSIQLPKERHNPIEISLPARRVPERRPLPNPRPRQVRRHSTSVPEGLSASHIKVLSRLRELLDVIGQNSVRKEQLAAWSEYSPNSGGFNNYLGTLRSAGLIEYPTPGYVAITNDGDKLAQPEEIPVSSEEMLERAKRVLGGSEARLLELLHTTRDTVTKTDLAQAAGFSPNSGGFNNYLGHMRTLGFIEYPKPGEVRCSDWLFI